MKQLVKVLPVGRNILPLPFLALLLTGLLSACDNSPQTGSLAGQPSQPSDRAFKITGIVKPRAGYIRAGMIKVADSAGKTVASTEVGSDSRFVVTIPAGSRYPVVVTVLPAKDQTSKDPLKVVVLDQSVSHFEVTPLTTNIAKKAKSLGGYTRQNMVQAALSTVARPDRNTSAAGFRGDPTKRFGGWH